MIPSSRSSDVWRLRRAGAIAWVTCSVLEEIAGVGHAFSTRIGDGGEFDIGPVGDRAELHASRLRQLLRLAGLEGQALYALRQVHGGVVAAGGPPDSVPCEADAVVRHREERPRLALGVRTADCVPLLLASRDGVALAAVHAGWRGTVARIASTAVERLARWGIEPAAIVAACGPSIGPCCYEVGTDVAAAVARASGVEPGRLCHPSAEAGARLDLREANRLQLETAGVPAAAVHVAPWCTACHADLFFSFRRDGPTGRLLATIGWSGDS